MKIVPDSDTMRIEEELALYDLEGDAITIKFFIKDLCREYYLKGYNAGIEGMEIAKDTYKEKLD